MRVSLKWLSDYVDIDVPVEKLKELLDLSGTKVETVTRPGKDIDGVIVATVRHIEPHPNADSLSLVDVTVEDEEQRVVCGAGNFVVGDRVPLARVGARLPGMEIGERKIRGEVSAGMLCSAAELGISKDHSGILVLPGDSPEGEDVVALLGLDDTILELEITPNRGDCMSLIGIAREVAAVLHNELRIPSVPASPSGAPGIKIDIEDPEGCTRYLGQLADVKLGSSSPAIARRLLAAGMRPISNIVDVTNYVMLETGQPLHAFDADKVADRTITVRRARKKETLELLDGRTISLDPHDLMIADPSGSLALAGVMGGAASEVGDTTTTILLESAHFDPRSISYTTRRHNIRSEASARFERNVDPNAVPYAAARVMALLAEIDGGKTPSAPLDMNVKPVEPWPIVVRPRRTTAILGVSITDDAQVDYLESIGIEAEVDVPGIVATVPTFRADLTREIDLIEEIGRLAGYERIDSTLPPGLSGGLDEAQAAERKLKEALATLGLFEVWTPALTQPGELDLLGLDPNHPARSFVRLENPMSEDETVLRTSLMPSLLRTVARNTAHRADHVSIFEIARVYEPTNERLPREAAVLSFACTGAFRQGSWLEAERRWDVFALKSVMRAELTALGVDAISYEAVSGMPFHPTRGGQVSIGGAFAGVVGEVHPDVCARFEVPEGTVVLEVALSRILAAMPGTAKAIEPPRFPSAFMDIAVVVDDNIPAGAVGKLIEAAGAPELVSQRLFDIYKGDQVGERRKSLAYALELRSDEATLTDDQTTAVRDRIVNALAERLGAELRS